MAVRRVDLCIVCKINKQRWANGCCDRCHALVEAEKSHKRLGVPTESDKIRQLRADAKEYNKLVRAGMMQKEISEKWGWPQAKVASMVYRAKTSLGIPMMNVVTGRLSGIAKYKSGTDSRLRRNEHGGGKCGIRGCKCAPCVERRRLTRKLYGEDYKPRRRMLYAAKKKKEQEET